jgi:hypothetical protein
VLAARHERVTALLTGPGISHHWSSVVNARAVLRLAWDHRPHQYQASVNTAGPGGGHPAGPAVAGLIAQQLRASPAQSCGANSPSVILASAARLIFTARALRPVLTG